MKIQTSQLTEVDQLTKTKLGIMTIAIVGLLSVFGYTSYSGIVGLNNLRTASFGSDTVAASTIINDHFAIDKSGARMLVARTVGETRFANWSNVADDNIVATTTISYLSGELIVKYKESVSDKKAKQFAQSSFSEDIRVEKIIKDNPQVASAERKTFNRVYKAKGIEGNIFEAAQKLRENSAVEYAEPNYIYKIEQQDLRSPNKLIPEDPIEPTMPEIYYAVTDPMYDQQWGHRAIKSEAAWQIQRGNSGVVIADVDTGVDYTHEDLAANIWINADEIANNGLDDDNNGYVDDIRGYDFVNLEEFDFQDYCDSDEDCMAEDSDPMDVMGHGTHVAGIIGAEHNNGVGIAGMCPGCSIMPVRAGFKYGGGGSLMLEDIVQAIIYAADNGADVINMSFGGPEAQTEEDAINYAYQQGVTLVAAAGNSRTRDPFYAYPAAYPEVIAVGALNQGSEMAWFSNYGSWVDVSAPGEWIMSTLPGNQYEAWSGTSMAAPHVAGLVGLMKAQRQFSDQIELATVLRNNLTAASSLLNDTREYPFDSGVVNASSIVSSLINGKAEIRSPQEELVLRNNEIIALDGFATMPNFLNYALQIGAGSNPESWQTFYKSTSSVDGFTLGSIASADIPDGEHMIRLAVQNADGQFIYDQIRVFIDNVYLQEITSNDVYKLGDTITIRGHIPQRASIQVARAEEETENYSTDGITMFTHDFSVDNRLATFNSSVLAGDGLHKFKVDVCVGQLCQSVSLRGIFFSSDMRQGWPLRIPYDRDPWSDNDPYCIAYGGCSIWPGFLEPVPVDLDNDGSEELVVNKGGFPARVIAYNQDGTQRWEREYYWEIPGGNLTAPAVADLDRDNQPEIVVYNPYGGGIIDNVYYGEVVIINSNGEIKKRSLVKTNGLAFITIADINFDNHKEIIVNNNRKYFQVLDAQGNLILEKTLEGGCMWYLPSVGPQPVIGDFDLDTDLEVVILNDTDYSCATLTHETQVQVLNLDGTNVPGWPQTYTGLTFSSPVVADLNGDYLDDVLISFEDRTSWTGKLHALSGNGQELPGWPYQDWDLSMTPAAVVDVNNDGSMEVIAGAYGWSRNPQVFVFDTSGQILSGWPQELGYYSLHGITVSDISGDGTPDVVAAGGGIYQASGGNGGIYGWTGAGDSIAGFPKFTNPYADISPIIRNIDSDQKLELIAGSDYEIDLFQNTYKKRASLYLWDLDTVAVTQLNDWPTAFHDNQRTGYLYSQCSDDVYLGDCLDQQPLFCGPSQEIVYNCSVCGCPGSQYCDSNGYCSTPRRPKPPGDKPEQVKPPKLKIELQE